jgi:hypothetical protein
MRPLRAIAIALLTVLAGCGRGRVPLAPYAVPSPLPRPMPFAGGIRTVNGIAFTPDGTTLYTSDWVSDLAPDGRRRARIFERRFEHGAWSAPRLASFSSAYTDYQPVMHPNGRQLFFQSTRPVPNGTTEVLQNLWVVDRQGDGWSEPRFLAELNTDAREGYVSPLVNGDLYFNSDRPGGLGGQDFYRARLEGGRYSAALPVAELNTADSENDLYVDPRGRFVIFNRYIDATRSIDLYISYPKPGGGWDTPRLLDAVNGPGWEITPSVTPDGRYFMYSLNNVIMQVDLAAALGGSAPAGSPRGG